MESLTWKNWKSQGNISKLTSVRKLRESPGKV